MFKSASSSPGKGWQDVWKGCKVGQKERTAPGWVGKLAGAHLALCGLQGGSSLHGGGVSPMFQ